MIDDLLDKLQNKKITKESLAEKIKHDFSMIPEIVKAMDSNKATIRYGCGKILMDLSEEYPEKLYPYMDSFVTYLDSKYRIIIWQAMHIIANLTKVDSKKKFDKIFNKYYSFLNDEYMVTVANVVGHSEKIANAKPYLIQKITENLLKIDGIKTTPHLTDECKRVIAEKAISSFDIFFDKIENKEKVISFVKKHSNSSRKSLKINAQDFLKKWNC
jgi:hypothetical protein